MNPFEKIARSRYNGTDVLDLFSVRDNNGTIELNTRWVDDSIVADWDTTRLGPVPTTEELTAVVASPAHAPALVTTQLKNFKRGRITNRQFTSILDRRITPLWQM